MAHATDAEDRGREAERPRDIPRAGWRDILLRTKDEITRDHVSMIAAGVAFYGLLALFPAIAALLSLWGLAFDPQTIEQQIEQVGGALPDQAAAIIEDQARRLASGTSTGTGLAAIGGLVLTLYSASKGMKALIEGLNIIYDEEEKRGFIKLNLIAFLLTLAMFVMMVVTLGAIVVLPALLGALGFGSVVETLVVWLRWPLLALVAGAGLAVLYRLAPSRSRPQWQWVSWGAVIATVIWVIGSILFSVYVRNFGTYNETYGSLGAVIVLLLWFWLSAFVVLMGAELNSEIEHQTARDTTDDGHRPMGERGAHVADTVGERR